MAEVGRFIKWGMAKREGEGTSLASTTSLRGLKSEDRRPKSELAIRRQTALICTLYCSGLSSAFNSAGLESLILKNQPSS